MTDGAPKKSQRRKPTSSKKSTSSKPKKQNDKGVPGLIPAMQGVADLLPEPFKTDTHTIIGIFGKVVVGMFAIFFIGLFVAPLTGHPEQNFTIFPTYIYGIGAAAVIAISLITKKS